MVIVLSKNGVLGACLYETLKIVYLRVYMHKDKFF